MMFQKLRAIARLTATVALALGLFGVRVLSLPFGLVSRRLDRLILRSLFRTWATATAHIFGMRITVQGKPPTPPFFLVTNHLTYLDGIVLASQLGCVFLAKSEVADWPVLGFLARQVNVIFVQRQKRYDTLRVNDLIADTLARGEGVVMFAESTTSKGDAVQPFKTALFESAARNGFPVHYAAIRYVAPPSAPPASEWITWWREVSFGEHLMGVLRRKRLSATVTFGDEPLTGTDRKVLAQQLHDAVQRIFVPVE